MENNLRTVFSDAQYSLAYPENIENNWWHLARNKIITNSILSLELDKPVVLEIGCGRGITVKHLRDENIECIGVELGHLQPLMAVAQFVQVGKDVFELTHSEKKNYNVLLLLDVVEHLPEPEVFLQALTREFSNLKNIIITVPACPELWSNYDEFYGHFRRYSADMLLDLSHSIGWQLIKRDYFFHTVYLTAWIMAKLKIKRQIKLNPPNKNILWLHKLIAFAMSIDYKMLPKTISGTSLIGVLTSPDR